MDTCTHRQKLTVYIHVNSNVKVGIPYGMPTFTLGTPILIVKMGEFQHLHGVPIFTCSRMPIFTVKMDTRIHARKHT